MDERATLSLVTELKPEVARKLNLRCTRCGYGVFRASPPERCPMCQASSAWVHLPMRPSAVAVGER